jgi:hypothetical protein
VVPRGFINTYPNPDVRCGGFDLFVANPREQPFAFGMLCTDTKRDRFFSGLDGIASRCSRRFCAATVDVRTRRFRRAP